MKLQREVQDADATLGTFYDDDGTALFDVLEPPTPMPAGTYPLVLRFSPSHGYAVPGYQNVPGHRDIEMHPGNWPRHTKDCTLPGDSRVDAVDPVKDGGDGLVHHMVTNSRETFRKFMAGPFGVPNFKELRDWDDVKDFLDKNPDAGRASVEIIDV